MENIKFKSVVLYKDETTDKSVLNLIADALGGERFIEDFQKRVDYPSGNTLILGGYIGDELVCMNVFMRMNFRHKNKIIHGYQSGFSATSNQYRGRGLWPQLMKFSEAYLSENKASFIYGFPNPVSHPVFMKKLGYESFDMHRVKILPTVLWSSGQFNMARFEQFDRQGGVIEPVLEENIAWKQGEYGSIEFRSYRHKSSFAWGRLKFSKKLGFKLGYFEIGGVKLSSGQELQGLLYTILRGERVLFCTICVNERNEYLSLFKSHGLEEEPLIIKMLDDLKTEDLALNFFSGLRDTF